jgi:uncharacterized protein
MTEITFKGPAGRIEAKYHQNEDPQAPVVLILPPNPLEGANFDNAITYELFKIFTDNAFSALRFNFRGIGKSEGKSDKGEGELLDAIAALDWLHQKNMDTKSFWIAGYDFGAWIALQLAMRRPEIEEYVLISPLSKKKDFNFVVPCAASGLLIHGDYDEMLPEEQINNLVEKLSSKAESKVEFINIEGANHSFENYIDELNFNIDNYIKKQTIENFEEGKKSLKRDRRRRRRKKKEKEEIQQEEKSTTYTDPIKPLELD